MCTCTGTGYRGITEITRIKSSLSAIASLLPILITCRAASTHKYKCVAFKRKNRCMINENNIMLVGHYVEFLKFICMYLERVYELKEVKLISLKSYKFILPVKKILTDKIQKKQNGYLYVKMYMYMYSYTLQISTSLILMYEDSKIKKVNIKKCLWIKLMVNLMEKHYLSDQVE